MNPFEPSFSSQILGLVAQAALLVAIGLWAKRRAGKDW